MGKSVTSVVYYDTDKNGKIDGTDKVHVHTREGDKMARVSTTVSEYRASDPALGGSWKQSHREALLLVAAGAKGIGPRASIATRLQQSVKPEDTKASNPVECGLNIKDRVSVECNLSSSVVFDTSLGVESESQGSGIIAGLGLTYRPSQAARPPAKKE